MLVMLSEPVQRLTRLAPLREVFACIDAIASPVAAREVEVAQAVGLVMAADVAAATPVPPRALALRDGWAVASGRVSDAGPHAPAPLVPPPAGIEAGAPLPDATDAVLEPEAVVMTNGMAEAVAAAAAGDHVLPAGADADTRPLRRAGQRLRASDIAALTAVGIRRVAVHEARVCVVATSTQRAVSDLIARAVACAGGSAAVA